MQLAFGGGIAFILLGLYLYALVIAIMAALKMGVSFTDGFQTTLHTVGGLVSALVIAELAITQPGTTPVARALDATRTNIGGGAASAVKGVTILYLVAWIIAGLAAYVVGVLWFPKDVPALTDLGNAWLGLAVAAGYAYFGITPK